MANYSNLIAGIDAVIKTNGRQEISGAALNTQLKNMISELGTGYQYKGVATPATNPGSPDANVFYLASEAGTYTNFGGIVINEGEVCALVWNGTWTKEVTGAATADQLNQLGQQQIAQGDGTTENIYPFRTNVFLQAGKRYVIYFKTAVLVGGSHDDGIYIDVNGAVSLLQHISRSDLYAGYYFSYQPENDCEVLLRIRQSNVGYTYTIFENINDVVGEQLKDIDFLKSKSFGEIQRTSGVSQVTTLIETGMTLKAGKTYSIYCKTATQISTISSAIGLWVDDGSTHILVNFTPEQLYAGVTYNYTPSVDSVLYFRTKETGISYSIKLLVYFPDASEYFTEQLIDAQHNQWMGKNVVVYGDSITAQGNGDNPTTNAFLYWAKQFYKFANLYVRGVGGQTYIWNTLGWYTGTGMNGRYLDRYNYDAQGNRLTTIVSPISTTAEEIANIEAKYNTDIEIHYGAFCSWDRIKAMVPSSIRETIDLVILCGGHNDFDAVEEVEVEGDMSAAEPVWIPNDVTDPTWAADSAYYKGGDYDITTFSGAIASTILKMQTWCPNAVVIIATPFPRFNTITKQQYKNSQNVTFRRMCEIQKYVAENVCSNVIDANAKCEITGVSFGDYVEDGVHPNLAGRGKYGAVFVGEIGRIGTNI